MRTLFEVIYKGVTFIQDKKILNRLHFAGNYCDIPSGAITGLKAERNCIIVECDKEKFKLILNGPKDWYLIDISAQTLVLEK